MCVCLWWKAGDAIHKLHTIRGIMYIVGGIISGIYWLSELITVAFTVTLKFVATVEKMFLKVAGDSLSYPNIPLPVMLRVCQKYQ